MLSNIVDDLGSMEYWRIILKLADVIAILAVAYFTMMMKRISSEQRKLADADKVLRDEIGKTIADAIYDRNKRFDRVEADLKAHEEATLSLADRIHACQLENISKYQRSELRNEDLKRIDSTLTEIWAAITSLKGGQATAAAKIEELLLYFRHQIEK